MVRQRVYKNDNNCDYMKLLAPYYNAIETTEINFENEKIIAYVDSLGHLEFFDQEKKSLGYLDIPVSKDPSEKGHTAQYGDVRCYENENTICFLFPVYGWEDYYPHCDGESDRWNRYIARWFRVLFDCSTYEISVEDL